MGRQAPDSTADLRDLAQAHRAIARAVRDIGSASSAEGVLRAACHALASLQGVRCRVVHIAQRRQGGGVRLAVRSGHSTAGDGVATAATRRMRLHRSVYRAGRHWASLVVLLDAGAASRASVATVVETSAVLAGEALDRLDAYADQREAWQADRVLWQRAGAAIAMGRGRVVLRANDYMATLLGYDGPDELAGVPARVFYAREEDFDRIGEALHRLGRRGEVHVPDVRLARKDGTSVRCEVVLAGVVDATGETIVWTARPLDADGLGDERMAPGRGFGDDVELAEHEVPRDGARHTSVHAYDAGARRALATVWRDVEAGALRFLDGFIEVMQADETAGPILARLSEAEAAHLRRVQAGHLLFLLGPMSTRELVKARGQDLGAVHALAGVPPALVSRAMTDYRELLDRTLHASAHPVELRERVLAIAGRRFQDDLEGEWQGFESVTSAYLDAAAAPLAAPGMPWPDVVAAELTALNRLPGVLGTVLLRRAADGHLTVERAVGAPSALVGTTLETLAEPRPAAEPEEGSVSWRLGRGEVLTERDLEADPRLAPLWRMAGRRGARSLVAVPAEVVDGRPHLAVVLLGRYRAQFASAFMRRFLVSLRQRWENLARPVVGDIARSALPDAVAQAYRQRVRDGAVRFDVQPIVSAATGRTRAVEMLARLVGDDGATIPPGAFLPALGESDLTALFFLSLERGLAFAARSGPAHAADDALGVTVNLPPTVLALPDLPARVAAAVGRHGVAPGRLTLEVLESQAVEPETLRDAMVRLAASGVRLALDDLGAGYSSLQRLVELPFDVIKVDQSLVRGVYVNTLQTITLVDAVVQAARRLGREVVLEGLEDEGMVESAVALGVPLLQGYALARPMAQDAFAGWQAGPIAVDPVRAPRTALGNLTHHWKMGHGGSLGNCPLTSFTRTGGVGDASLVGRLHETLHRPGESSSDAFDALTDHLVQAVRAARPAA